MHGDLPPGGDPTTCPENGGDPRPEISNKSAFVAVMTDVTSAVVGLVSAGVTPDAALTAATKIWDKIVNHDIVAIGVATFACDKMPTASYARMAGPQKGEKQRFQRTVRNDPNGVFRSQCAMQEQAMSKDKARQAEAKSPHDMLREVIRTSGLSPSDLRCLASDMELARA